MERKIALFVLSVMHFNVFGMHINVLLFKAVKKGKLKVIEWCLDNHANINMRMSGSMNPIKLNKKLSCTRHLIPKPYINNWTPLHIAVANGYVKIARLLLQRGANRNDLSGPLHRYFGGTHNTPMEMAVITGKLSMVKLLNEYVDTDFKQETYFAVRYNHFEVFKFLLNQQSDMCLSSVFDIQPWLTYAIQHGYMRMIKYFIKNKIEKCSELKKQFKQICSDQNFISLCVDNDNQFLLEYLLELGVSPNTDILGVTPLHNAAFSGKVILAKTLLKYGAHINAGDYRSLNGAAGGTPLHYAVNGEHIEMVKFLLQQSADLHALDMEDKTPVYCARGNPQMLYWLLLHGAGIDDQLVKYAPVKVTQSHGSDVGKTSFDMERIFSSWRTNKKEFYSYGLFVAAYFEDYELMQKLFEHGADANIQNSAKDTPLTVALKNNNLACAYRLLTATKVKKDEQGKLPIDYAQTPAIKDMINWYTQDRHKFYHLGLLLASKHGDGDLIEYCVGHGYIKRMNNPEQTKTNRKRKWSRDHGQSKRLKRTD